MYFPFKYRSTVYWIYIDPMWLIIIADMLDR